MASNRRSSAEPGPTESLTIVEEATKEQGVIRRYSKGRFLGKVKHQTIQILKRIQSIYICNSIEFQIDKQPLGGFAKCYEFTNLETRKILAAKVIPKSSLTKNRARQKVSTFIQFQI